MSNHPTGSATDQTNRMERYYRFHSKIYDATRWSFLFGRTALLKKISAHRPTPARILEVGCGTGYNLIKLAALLPQAQIVGLDVSESMLAVARHKLGPLNGRVELLSMAYDGLLQAAGPSRPADPFDLVLFSYSLTMINPGWADIVDHAHNDLAPGGRVAVVDFHDSPVSPFKRWMGLNHVRMDGHLLPKLKDCFTPQTIEVRPAYAGLWQYLIFIGQKES